MSKTETPKEGTGSEGEGKPQTPDNTKTQEEPNGKPTEGTESTENSAAAEGAGEAVFSVDDGIKSSFKTVEAAEKSYKESQKYVAELQGKVKELQATHPAPEDPPRDPESREVEVLKARLKMNEVFDDFATENPDFKGKIRTVARDIIETNVRAGKSIKMVEAYHMAKGKLTAFGETQVETQTEQELNAAAIGGSGAVTRYTKDGSYQPSEKEQGILNNLPSLSEDGKKRVLDRMKK